MFYSSENSPGRNVVCCQLDSDVRRRLTTSQLSNCTEPGRVFVTLGEN